MAALFQRLQDQQRASVEIIVDGDRLQALEGDTLLTAILLNRPHLRRNEVDDEPRAGFCLMGACQDCWLSDGDGNRLRACTTYVRAGLEVVTGVVTAAISTAPRLPASTPAIADAVAESDPSSEPTSGATQAERKTEGEPPADKTEDDPAEEGHS